uniref:Sfi1 spindle body domain-containing protein n=1 Tax=Globisporangium ultimum (strain ATCC 200006 / CBS 805.95 / DAOM BR144) TaxID=431595 RepID=K3WGQ5_GLOUD
MLATARQRQSLRQVLLAWRWLAGRRKDEASTSRSTQLIVYSRYCSRLLGKAFQSWHARYLQQLVLMSLVRVFRRYTSTLVQLAWSSWKQHVYKITQLQKKEIMRRMRTMEQVWKAWTHRTSEKRTKERHRRLAVRFSYKSLLRKVFSSFLLELRHQLAVAEEAEKMGNRRRKRTLKRDFVQWRVFVAYRQRKSRENAIAVQFRDGRLMKRVWTHGLVHFVNSKRSKTSVIENALQQYHRNIKKAAFEVWSNEWKEQRAREQLLASRAAQFKHEKDNLRKRQVFTAWVEHLRKRQTSRLVNVHARGHWQVNVLQKSFSQWVAKIADFRWRQIQNQRAQKRYALTLKEKYFQFWKRKVEARDQYREQNRKALIHWKLAMERRFFPMLKQYAESKKVQRARMRDALEFRHKLIVSDGVRHWMTASLHLQGQREKKISQSQALHTAQIWRTVARIARHWRLLTVKNRQSRDKSKLVGAAFRIQDTCLTENFCMRRIQNRVPPVSLQAEKERLGSLQPRAAIENT